MEIDGLTLKDGWKERHPLMGRKAAAEVQGECMIVSKMSSDRWLVEATVAVDDKVLKVAYLHRMSGWIEAICVDEEVVVVAAQSADEMTAVPGCHIQNDIVEMAVGMRQECMVDGTERERNHCRSMAWDYVVSVESYIAVDYISAGHAEELEQQLGSGIRYRHLYHKRSCVEDIPASRCQ